MSFIQKLIDRYVVHEPVSREQLYREEAGRVRSGDLLSWAVLLTGFVPLAWQNLAFSPVWLGRRCYSAAYPR